jgi:cell division septation protein DedD
MKYSSHTLKPHFAISVFILIMAVSFGPRNDAFPDEVNPYSIHLLTFKAVDEAKVKVKEFKDLGYNAFYKQEKTGDKNAVYNVFIERFKTRAEAEKEAKILKDLNLITDYDVRDISGKGKSDTIDDKTDQSRETKNNLVPSKSATTESVNNNHAPKKSEKTENNKNSATGTGTDVQGYYLKVSSLREKANAEEVVRTLQNAGYHAFYNYEKVKGMGDWYRVYLDGYQSKEDAEKDAKKLKGSGIISGYEIKRATGIIKPSETAQKEEKKIYCLNVASYKDSVLADEEVRRLTELGLKAVSKNTEVSGEQWVLVYVGEFSDEKEAGEKGAELIQKGVISYFKPMLIP